MPFMVNRTAKVQREDASVARVVLCDICPIMYIGPTKSGL